MDRTIPFRQLRQILSRYGIHWNARHGKGSHGCFEKLMAGGYHSYPVPNHGKDVLIQYVRGCRKKFKLTSGDGISDSEFYDG